MSQTTTNASNGVEYDSDFTHIIREMMDALNDFDIDMEVVNDHTQLRFTLTPSGLSESEEDDIIRSASESALESPTSHRYTVDMFSADGGYMVVFAPKEF